MVCLCPLPVYLLIPYSDLLLQDPYPVTDPRSDAVRGSGIGLTRSSSRPEQKDWDDYILPLTGVGRS